MTTINDLKIRLHIARRYRDLMAIGVIEHDTETDRVLLSADFIIAELEIQLLNLQRLERWQTI